MTHWVTHDVFRVVLASGHEVIVEAVHMEATYAGFDGVPDGDYNAKKFVSKANRTVKIWGERPVHLIRPEITRHPVASFAATHGEFLPEITYHVWLNDSKECRELVVMWFGPPEPHMSIYGLVERAIRKIDWPVLSKEYIP